MKGFRNTKVKPNPQKVRRFWNMGRRVWGRRSGGCWLRPVSSLFFVSVYTCTTLRYPPP